VSLYDLNVLIVDDSKHMRTILAQVMRGLGVRSCCQAESGAEALRLMDTAPFDLIVTDMEMPDGDGLWLVRALRGSTDRARSMIPIIVLTAHSTEVMVARARDAGATEFVTKPFSVKSLVTRLEEVIFRPRPFIRTDSYYGPDRRRHKSETYVGPERRSALLIDTGTG
jgi:CheY-like chemotaxis protein